MPEHNVVSWTAMLAAYSEIGNLGEAIRIFNEIRQRDIDMPQTDLITWTALLTAYSQDGNVEEAKLSKAVFGSMPRRTVASWTVLSAAYSQSGQVEMARKLFGCMPQRDTAAWGGILAAYASNGLPGQALDLFFEMQLEEAPNAACFEAALAACVHLGQMDAARSIFVSMRESYGVHPSKRDHCCIADLLCRAGSLDDAMDLIAAMPFAPDDLEWSCVLRSCRNGADLAIARAGAKYFDPRAASGYVLVANAMAVEWKR
ncbi:hypothetical protein SELMODRAFT_76944 [Selaginella moellendorffii]|uniref:Pentacotripeptide-repeat region of PRORP domain-containing protein n=1 Tax=Selaginella moellendorffii TaxID=88036 RepID=D8QRD6_SELML|nr:hypothetical protein SELMODRAFT_76944 [Selaginella moellendorffii]